MRILIEKKYTDKSEMYRVAHARRNLIDLSESSDTSDDTEVEDAAFDQLEKKSDNGSVERSTEAAKKLKMKRRASFSTELKKNRLSAAGAPGRSNTLISKAFSIRASQPDTERGMMEL